MFGLGPDVSFANCGLPYFIRGEIAALEVLAVQTPALLKALLNLDVRTRCEGDFHTVRNSSQYGPHCAAVTSSRPYPQAQKTAMEAC